MSPRYAIVVGPEGLVEHSVLEPGSLDGRLSRKNRSRLAILTSASTKSATISPANGRVVGEIYHRHGPRDPLASIDETVGQALGRGDFRDLIRRYWGSYIVAIECGDSVIVGRDPSATMPCYRMDIDQYSVFASHVSLFSDLNGLPHAIDWNGVSRHLFAGTLPTRDTSLKGVTELLPGTAVRLRAGASEILELWSPWAFVASRPNVSIDDNIIALRRTVQTCVAARARQFKRPIITVSGGLDSSIVAAVAAPTSQDLLGMTMYTDDPAGDERAYAQALCDALGMGLTAVRYDVSSVDIGKPYSPHLPRPVGRTIGTAYESALIAVAKAEGADGFLSGNGGDNAFAYSRSAKPVVDRYLREGLGRGVIGTISDIATMAGASYAEVVRAAWRTYRKRRRPYRWTTSTRFLHPDLVCEIDREPLSHPWLQGPDDALPGQLGHIAGILHAHRNLDPQRGLAASAVAPLMSQPILELCLGIPSWHWCHGGRDRSPIRSAFKVDLPDLIAARRVKGTPDGFNAEILPHYQTQIKERLLSGRLMNAGLLDRAELGRVLDSPRDANPGDRTRIVDLLDTEAWLDHWTGVAGASPASRRS